MVLVSMFWLTHCSCGYLAPMRSIILRRLSMVAPCGLAHRKPLGLTPAYAFGTAYAHSHLLIATACELRTPMHSSAFAKRSSAKLI